MVRWLVLAPIALALVSSPSAAAGSEEMDPELRERARRSVDAGLHYLRGTQAEDGSWSKSVGVTAIALRGFLESHRGYSEVDGAFITRPVAFLLQHVNRDGSIVETNQNRSYSTAVALVALKAANNAEYDEVIRGGQRFLGELQLDEAEGYDPEHPYYGGIGYGGDERPDLTNHYLALEALRTTALDPKSPVWDKALLFLQRCQNRSESNDQAWASNDGGFTYMPGYSPHGGTASYGGAAHAGLIGLLFAGIDRDDPRIRAAHDWIRAHYTLETHPGTQGSVGLYFYYTAFAKTLAAYGEPRIVTTDGEEHDWRSDFARKMLSLQSDDGSWVNSDSARWMEGDKNLTTARIVVALNLALR